jgi:protein-tyrosine phosphatase
MNKTKLLFVCMGNICRSPTAEGVMRAHLQKVGIASQVEIDSAGTHAYHIGKPPDARAQKAAAGRGYDLSALRARQVASVDFERYDLILAMDSDNIDNLRRDCPPEHQHKLKLFLDYAHAFAEHEVPDPYYGGEAGFQRVLDLIEDAARGLAESLQEHG